MLSVLGVLDRFDPDATGNAHGETRPSGWSRAACIRAPGTQGTVDLFTDSSTDDDVLLQIHERDENGAHLVEAAIRLDRRAACALALLLEREGAR